jgi:hypothetical protein
MAIWISTTIRATGTTEQVQRIRRSLNEHTRERNGERITQFSDIAGRDNMGVKWGVRWSWPDDEEYQSIVWMGECPSGVPSTFVT